MVKFITGALIASAALAASPALAVDAFTEFNGTNGAGGFFYGTGVGGTLTDFDTTSTGSSCALAGGTCMTSSAYPVIPFVSKGGSYSTVDYDGTTLAVHPLDNNTGVADVFAAFQATNTSTYKYSIKLKSIGTDTTNGVGYRLFTDNVFGTRSVLPTYTSSATLTGSVVLTAGQRFGAIVDANGAYGGDSTAVTFGITAVPEPAQWALMIGGFGMVGGAMRRRRTLVAA